MTFRIVAVTLLRTAVIAVAMARSSFTKYNEEFQPAGYETRTESGLERIRSKFGINVM